MKKYKNVLLSLGSYILAIPVNLVFLLLISQFFPTVTVKLKNGVALTPLFIMIVLGIFFALRSKKKEPPLASSLVILIGIALLLGSYILYSYYSGFSG